jgi:hypothetical protein
MCSVVMCAVVSVMVCYKLGETKGNEKGSVVMCAGLVQGEGFGGRSKGFSGVLCCFGLGGRDGRSCEMFSGDVC